MRVVVGVVIDDPHSAVQRCLLGNGCLLLIVKLPSWSVDVDVALSAGVLVALDRTVLCDPAELPRSLPY